MRGFFAWALEEKLFSINLMEGVRLLAGENDAVGFHTWSEAELARFEAFWAVGTRERLAFDLIPYTGLRHGDVVR
jgi:integrase